MFLNAAMAQSKTLSPSLTTQASEAEGSKGLCASKDFASIIESIAGQRDKEAFIQLFEHFAPRIKSFLIKSGLSPELSDELAQETMLTVWNKADQYNPERAAPSTWIFTIARNKRIDALRKTKYHDLNPVDPLLIEDERPDPGKKTQHNEETELLTRALETLPEEQAFLIRKSFFEDKPHAEIAEETGIALGTVKSRIRLALERLRKDPKLQDIWS